MDDGTKKIFVANHLTRYSVRIPRIKRIAAALTKALGVEGYEVAIEFVGPGRMRTINRTFRSHDKSTDVLSFPQQTWKTPLKSGNQRRTLRVKKRIPGVSPSLGDVIISIPDAQRNARAIGQGLDREVGFLLVHGVLHLCGHDHIEKHDERQMRAEQRRLMTQITRSSPSPLWHLCVTERSN